MKLIRHVLQLTFIFTFYISSNKALSNWLNSKIKSHYENNETISAPWIASLRQKSNNQHYCSGSIISYYFIISTAHCSFQPPEMIIAVVGTRNLFIGGYKYDISDSFIHPEYNRQTLVNDLGLLRTVMPIIFGNKVYPIALESDCTAVGEPLNTFGWNFIHIVHFFYEIYIERKTGLVVDPVLCTVGLKNSMELNRRQICMYSKPAKLFCMVSINP